MVKSLPAMRENHAILLFLRLLRARFLPRLPVPFLLQLRAPLCRLLPRLPCPRVRLLLVLLCLPPLPVLPLRCRWLPQLLPAPPPLWLRLLPQLLPHRLVPLLPCPPPLRA